jgi:hypothetical protein
MKVKISREARILLGLMFLAAAILVWINFFTQQRQGFNLFGNQNTLPEYAASPDASATTDASSPATDSTALSGTELTSTELTSTDTTLVTPDAISGAVDASTSSEVAAIDPSTTDSSITVTAITPDLISPSAVAAETTTEASALPVIEVAPSESVVGESVVGESVASTEAVVSAPEVTVTAIVPEVATPDGAASEIVAPEVAVSPTVATPTAARDIQLAELPFLVTELAVTATEDLAAAEGSATVTRPGEQRASINPFAPIVLKPVEVEVAALPEGEGIVEVPIPDEPISLSTVPVPAGVETLNNASRVEAGGVLDPGAPTETAVLETPLPEALTPAPSLATLPRPLPGGTLPVAPDIMRTMSRTPEADIAELPAVVESQPQLQVAEVEAAIRLPEQSPAANASLSPLASSGTEESDLEPIVTLAADVQAAAVNGGPISAGLSGLSRYLRDNDVRFTGSVIGPVGVGVFRSNVSQVPYVITLGQSIPDTDIVLTSLQGKQAQFTQGQEIQVLTLDLRR